MKRRLFNILSAMSLLLCVATMVLWVRSYWNPTDVWFVWCTETDSNRVSMDSRHGQVALDYVRDHNGEPNWLGYHDVNAHAKWGFDFYHGQSNGREDYMAIWVPYWLLVLSTALSPLLWLNSHVKNRKRSKQGLCPKCGYDLRASKDRCPECGTSIVATEAKARCESLSRLR